MSCSPNTPIRWSTISGLAKRIDDLAIALQTPGYTTLASEAGMPFKFGDLVSFSGAIQFSVSVSNGVVTVTNQHLSTGVTSTSEPTIDNVLKTMGQNNDLYLVAQEDGCICNTLFKIDTSSGVPTVKEASQTGCCQNLFVPQISGLLDYGQHIIPAGYVKNLAKSKNPSSTSSWTVVPACEGGSVGAGFKFSGGARTPLTNCTREIPNAKFTWPIRASHFAKMIEKLKYILSCSKSGGAKKNALKTSSSDPKNEYVFESCEVSICMLVVDRVQRALMNYSSPGCVAQGCNLPSSTGEPSPYPWNAGTCGGTNCAGNGPKFYCRTIQDLESILDIAETGIRPYVPNVTVCAPCTCGVSIETEGRFGKAETCLLQYSAYIFFLQLVEAITYTRLGGGTAFTCTKTITTTYSTEARLLECQTGGSGTQQCNSSETVTNPSCPPSGFSYTSETTSQYIYGGAPSYISDALSEYNGCPDNVSGVGSAEYYDGFDGTADVASFRWRAVVGGTYNCTGIPQSFSVKVKRIATLYNVETQVATVTETSGTVTLSWNAGEKIMASSWVNVPIPAAVSRGIRSSIVVEYDDVDTVPCPSPCTAI